ncbi:cilia- and flagella-associated protein 57-like [Schistocerca piceifrons]|uniref:cilia- and flagella-associated protein 57-like n=1 Tax=Schistocerca piceifrons TaxID=274613 RepID=UPI001F5FEA06|nr:cilia- and flagella-associated protein 57-like [Schistocerca piceifrons]
MEKEFMDLQKMRTHLRLCINDLNEKLKGKEAALHTVNQANLKNKATLLQLQNDLQQTSEFIQDAVQLKSFVKKLYHKYGESKTKATEDSKKMDMHAELMRQRQHLEETVQSLRNQVYKNSLQKQKNASRIMQENKELLTELNMLRTKLKETQEHCAEMEAIIGVNKRCMSPEKARACLEKAIRNNEAIEYEYQQKLNVSCSALYQLPDDKLDINYNSSQVTALDKFHTNAKAYVNTILYMQSV